MWFWWRRKPDYLFLWSLGEINWNLTFIQRSLRWEVRLMNLTAAASSPDPIPKTNSLHNTYFNSWDVVSPGVVFSSCCSTFHRRTHSIAIILAHKDDRQVPQLCHVVSLKYLWKSKNRAVFKWPSKVITWLRLLSLVIGLKDFRQFFNQWEAKPKPTAPRTDDFSRALSELQVIASNSDWLITLSAPVVIGRSNYFGFGVSTVIWKPLQVTPKPIELSSG